MKIYPNAEILAEEFAEEIIKAIKHGASENRKISIALSGGSTPKMVFGKLAGRWGNDEKNALSDYDRLVINNLWNFVDFYWGDERCVPPDDPESNFGAAYDLFFSKISFPADNLHRVRGEDPPEKEVKRYSELIRKNVPADESDLPVFDWIILGLGTDGHTASLFPGTRLITPPGEICIIAEHPQTGQKRISLTLNVINNAKRVSFLVSGADKAKVVNEIINQKPNSFNYPAAKVTPAKCGVEWFVDEGAGKS